jgi:aminopeptidase 2
MLSEYVGEEKFLKGVSIYLKKHLYGSSVTKDLWTGIAEATGKDFSFCLTSPVNEGVGLDISAVMNNWILKVCCIPGVSNLKAVVKSCRSDTPW